MSDLQIAAAKDNNKQVRPKMKLREREGQREMETDVRYCSKINIKTINRR